MAWSQVAVTTSLGLLVCQMQAGWPDATTLNVEPFGYLQVGLGWPIICCFHHTHDGNYQVGCKQEGLAEASCTCNALPSGNSRCNRSPSGWSIHILPQGHSTCFGRNSGQRNCRSQRAPSIWPCAIIPSACLGWLRNGLLDRKALHHSAWPGAVGEPEGTGHKSYLMYGLGLYPTICLSLGIWYEKWPRPTLAVEHGAQHAKTRVYHETKTEHLTAMDGCFAAALFYSDTRQNEDPKSGTRSCTALPKAGSSEAVGAHSLDKASGMTFVTPGMCSNSPRL